MLEKLTHQQLLLVGAAAALISSGLIAAIVGAGIIFGGWYDVSASKPYGLAVSWILHKTMIHSVHARVHDQSAPKLDISAGSMGEDPHRSE
jgi:hypothetical protein